MGDHRAATGPNPAANTDPSLAAGTDGRAALSLGQAAVLHGAYCWVERRLHELAGAWAATVGEPAARVHLDVVSGQHAWHADLWAARLPALDGTDRQALVRPAGPAAGPLLEELAGLDGTVARLAGLYRVVLPRLLVTYERHLQRAAPVADAPAVRALRLVLRDEEESWLEGETLLQGLLTGPDQAVRAAEAQARLEATAVTTGVGPGLVPWSGGIPEPVGHVT